MNTIPHASEFDINAILLSELKRRRTNDSKYVEVSYRHADGEEDACMMQFPRSKLAYNGLSMNENDNGQKKYNIDLTLDQTHCSQQRAVDLLRTLNEIDNYIVEWATQNSETLFGKQKSEAVVRELYRPLVKESQAINENTGQPWAPTLKVRLPIRRSGPIFQLYRGSPPSLINLRVEDGGENEFDFSSLEKGASVVGILTFGSMWFVGKQFGLSVDLVQAKVYSPARVQRGYAIREDEADEEEEEAYVEEEEGEEDTYVEEEEG